MPLKRIGALIIGQSPRPDLVNPLIKLLPDCKIIQAGALDGLSHAEFPDPSSASYPLVTRLNNGSTVIVDEGYLSSNLQRALNHLENQYVEATLLLCAGTFASLQGIKPLFKPFDIGFVLLQAFNSKSIGLIAPVVEQEKPIRERWAAMGFQPVVWTADLTKQDDAFYQQIIQRVQKFDLRCIVLDYVGHAQEDVSHLQSTVNIPVLDLGYLAMAALASTL